MIGGLQPLFLSPDPSGMNGGRAFSLIELVSVVVILATIAAIAIPRVTSAVERANLTAYCQNLVILQTAVDHYRAEHNGQSPPSAAQLLLYTDEDGNTSATRGGAFVYGPYLHSMPALNYGDNIGDTELEVDTDPGAGSGGWVIDSASGLVRANLDDSVRGPGGVQLNALNGRNHNPGNGNGNGNN